ncbi:hypothetical protein PaecuDRAFT_4224 [Paenibacillus curdlanolyticus YK9]|uniref:Uncharacterized protein n=1 Tax=Paenibacillus curdlanolyticus YK9 TaxID=717606 RepID=E0IEY3_9BACL|nr:hypothetical protein [Paenibacillus curdlanolyticus]EFM08759.1 hypothetical protein PaecuDRAFT_4224 [Paenibacillus curdlanolyticus YK9]
MDFVKSRKLKSDQALIKPVYEMLAEDQQWLDDLWHSIRTGNHSEIMSECEIQKVSTFTFDKLARLDAYLKSIKLNKKSAQTLAFYREYVELLLKYHKNNKFDSDYILQYMYLYSELVLGSQRYKLCNYHSSGVE